RRDGNVSRSDLALGRRRRTANGVFHRRDPAGSCLGIEGRRRRRRFRRWLRRGRALGGRPGAGQYPRGLFLRAGRKKEPRNTRKTRKKESNSAILFSCVSWFPLLLTNPARRHGALLGADDRAALRADAIVEVRCSVAEQARRNLHTCFRYYRRGRERGG